MRVKENERRWRWSSRPAYSLSPSVPCRSSTTQSPPSIAAIASRIQRWSELSVANVSPWKNTTSEKPPSTGTTSTSATKTRLVCGAATNKLYVHACDIAAHARYRT
ncbi:hypothetical protein ACOSQ3_020362 [Xanthoceras sorbifolium]